MAKALANTRTARLGLANITPQREDFMNCCISTLGTIPPGYFSIKQGFKAPQRMITSSKKRFFFNNRNLWQRLCLAVLGWCLFAVQFVAPPVYT